MAVIVVMAVVAGRTGRCNGWEDRDTPNLRSSGRDCDYRRHKPSYPPSTRPPLPLVHPLPPRLSGASLGVCFDQHDDDTRLALSVFIKRRARLRQTTDCHDKGGAEQSSAAKHGSTHTSGLAVKADEVDYPFNLST